MQFTVEYPVGGPSFDPRLLGRDGVTRVVRRAEELGFGALALTEHPAPSLRWLESGGHETLDLTAALAFFAAATERIRLMTYLLVLPYHHPFLAAKALTTLDLLSGGRLTAVVGTGYLKSEYRNLGIDFDQRNERFDEALEVLRGLWDVGAPYDFEGKHFIGRNVASLPRPLTPGGPPIMIGGNSALSRRRAARAAGWSPLIVSEEVAATTRMPALSLPGLASRIRELRELTIIEQGPQARAFVQLQSGHSDLLRRAGVSDEEHRQHLGETAEAGVDAFVIQLPTGSVTEALDGLERYAQSFVVPMVQPAGP